MLHERDGIYGGPTASGPPFAFALRWSRRMTVPLDTGRIALVFRDANVPESSLFADVLVPETDGVHLLVLSYTHDASTYREGWQTAAGRPPKRTTIITARDDSTDPDEYDDFFDPSVRGRAATDLAGIGIDLNRYLTKWHADDAGIVLWVDSLSALLEYVDVETAFQFLHVLSGKIAATNAKAWILVDPKSHDERTLSIFTHLCDATVRFDRGAWRVTGR